MNILDFIPLDWVLALLVLILAGGLVYQFVALVPNERLVRCSEHNTITYIDIKPAPADKPTPSGVVVSHCGLWGEHKDCGQGCLARYDATRRAFQIDQHALRKFDLKSSQ